MLYIIYFISLLVHKTFIILVNLSNISHHVVHLVLCLVAQQYSYFDGDIEVQVYLLSILW